LGAAPELKLCHALNNCLPGGGNPQYDVSPADSRFVILRINDLSADPELILVENWAEALR